jgi:hypothetical protein
VLTNKTYSCKKSLTATEIDSCVVTLVSSVNGDISNQAVTANERATGRSLDFDLKTGTLPRISCVRYTTHTGLLHFLLFNRASGLFRKESVFCTCSLVTNTACKHT